MKKKSTLFGSLTPSKMSLQYWDVTQTLAFLCSLKSGVCSLTLYVPVHMPILSILKTVRQKEQTLEVILELKDGLLVLKV